MLGDSRPMKTLTDQMDFAKSRQLQIEAHRLIPGGCHTYSKGDDQFPERSPGLIRRGHGCHVWDVDGNEFIEFGMGLRSVTLGHAHREIIEAATSAMQCGTNFTRPAEIELTCAQRLLSVVPTGDMVKFTKDGSTATTAAVKLARAVTGREVVAFCGDHPFFSYDDWFIGHTPMNAGIPESAKSLSVSFRYNDIDSIESVFRNHQGNVACLIMEAAKYEDPDPGFLSDVQSICRQEGVLFILDEMITGFRWSLGGAQEYYGIEPDLSTFGKALGNGFAISALVGKREMMERGGLTHDQERTILLSTTHGAETHALAVAMKVIEIYQRDPVISEMNRLGQRLIEEGQMIIDQHGLADHVKIIGKPVNLVVSASDAKGQPSQEFRSLLLQEMIQRGVIMPSWVISYAHTDNDISHTLNAFDESLDVYARALRNGVEKFLVGPPSQMVQRKFNHQ